MFQQATERAEKYYGARIDTGNEKPRDRIAYAEVQLMKDRKDSAIERLQAGIKNSSVPQPELSVALSNVYLQEYEAKMRGKSIDQLSSDALNEFMMAINTAPTNPNLGTPAVYLLMNSKKLPVAAVKALQDLLKEQLRANVATPDTMMILGSLYYQKKLYKEADSAWQKVLAMNPNAIHALNNLAVLEFELPEPNAERALQRIQKAYESAPGNVEICDSYGQVLMKLNRPREAISKFESALQIHRQLDRKLERCWRSAMQTSVKRRSASASEDSVHSRGKGRSESRRCRRGQN